MEHPTELLLVLAAEIPRQHLGQRVTDGVGVTDALTLDDLDFVVCFKTRDCDRDHGAGPPVAALLRDLRKKMNQ